MQYYNTMKPAIGCPIIAFTADSSVNLRQLDDTLFRSGIARGIRERLPRCATEKKPGKLRQFTVVGITIICSHYCRVLR